MRHMNWPKRIWTWFRNRTRTRSASSETLREFVYLDEVSVYSLLASREHGIATQFTERQTAALNSEVGSSFNIGFAGLGSKKGCERTKQPDPILPSRTEGYRSDEFQRTP